ncbi:protein tyrosine phosphatase [Paenibacillus sp. 1P07SE]|uniref:protein tyrosine phosphatase n=1 Tax=Paenibacillus sp. 1P07SE TaxID=3132209 RepID=UPI0039A6F205
MIGWADLIFVMETKHRRRLEQKYPQAIAGKRMIRLDMPDEYKYMDEERIELLKARVAEVIDVPENSLS